VSLIRRLLSWSRTLAGRRTPDDEVVREMQFHVEMEMEKNIRAGMPPDEARRRALADFGGVQRFREEAIDVRGGRWLSGLSLDATLAWRMLRKTPGLTVIGVLGIAVGTAVSLTAFVMITAHFFPSLPVHESKNLVALENWNVEESRPAPRSLHDFATWRAELRAVQPIAAAALDESSLVTGDGLPEVVHSAEMTAEGFGIARVAPLLGRHLVPGDEAESAPHVALIGFDLWQRRFAGDPGVLDRTILVNGVEHAVVGVMPQKFAFPHSQEVWTALRANPLRTSRGGGPPLFVFGRLAPGATREQAQGELTAIGGRAAAAFPASNATLRPQVISYHLPFGSRHALANGEVAAIELIVNLLLIAVAVNVAMLVYARTAIRQGELAVRTALGASRGRIVGQLFVEALLLALLGSALGLASARLALGELAAAFPGDARAFWEDFGLEPRTMAFALVLAVVAAVIIGIVPALKATGRGLNASLQLLRSGTTPALGRTWTALIIGQVAVVVTVLPTALHMGVWQLRGAAERATFPAHEVVTARIGIAVPIRAGMGGDAYLRENAARLAMAVPEFERALEAEASVAGVTFEGGGGVSGVEVEGVAATDALDTGLRAVAVDYFGVLGVRVTAGRAFGAADALPGGGLVVSEAFVRDVLRGEPALGRRVRFAVRGAGGARTASPWREIVGVVEDLYDNRFDRTRNRVMAYHAVEPGELQGGSLLVRVRGGDANAFVPRLQQIASRGNDVRISAVRNLAVMPNARFIGALATGLAIAMGTVLLLSAVGIHALMSLTVTRRRKEIGIRVALGATSSRLLASIFSRAALQLGFGGLVGSLLGGVMLRFDEQPGAEAPALLAGVVGVMLLAGLVATAFPARRGMQIQPMEALRAEE
jgi:putative ABC transport system permease protein